MVAVACVLLVGAGVAQSTLRFKAPAMIGPASMACENCGPPWPNPGSRNGTGVTEICTGDGGPRDVNACQMCCAWFFALDERNYVGLGAGSECRATIHHPDGPRPTQTPSSFH